MKSINDPRHNARRLVLGTLFCALHTNVSDDACLELTKELLAPVNVDESLTKKIISGIKKHQHEIDGIIEKCAPEWPVDKIAKVDLVVLRIAVFEILYDTEAPDKVVIDEAVELAKEFGSDTSGKFVNGVLGTVVDIKVSIQKEQTNG